MTALTISHQAEKYKDEPFRYEMMSYVGGLKNSILSEMPFLETVGGVYIYNREIKRDGVVFRGIENDETDGGKYKIKNPQTEALTIFGGFVKVDQTVVAMNGKNELLFQQKQHLKKSSLNFDRVFIYGDSSVNPREFDGINKRLNESGDQVIKNESKNGSLSIDYLDSAINKVVAPTHIIMDIDVLRLIVSKDKYNKEQSELLSFTESEDGSKQFFYKGLKIIALDRDGNHEKIIGFKEEGDTSSIYVISLCAEGIKGIQNGDLYIEDLGLDKDENSNYIGNYLMLYEYFMSIVVNSGTCVSRLKGIEKKPIN